MMIIVIHISSITIRAKVRHHQAGGLLQQEAGVPHVGHGGFNKYKHKEIARQ